MNDRPIEELIKLTTWQDLTDTEFVTLTTYLKEQAYAEGFAAGKVATNTNIDANLIGMSENLATYSKQLLDTLCAQPVFLEVVDNG